MRRSAPRKTPIYVGAMGPKMLELCGEIADGALPLVFPPESYLEIAERIGRGVTRRSKGLASLDLAACLWVSIDEDEAVARQVLAQKIAYFGSTLSPMILERLKLEATEFAAIRELVVEKRDIERAAALIDERMMRIGIAGTPETVARRVEQVLGYGVHHLSFGPPLGRDPLLAVKLLGEVLAGLKAAS